MNVPHIFQYQGSKRNLASHILRYFPVSIGRLIEPFAGSAAISIAAAARGSARAYMINDLNKPLANLLRLIVNNPDEVAAAYSEIWRSQHDEDSIAHFYNLRDQFNISQEPVFLLYLLARCVKGSVRYNSEGLFNQSPDKRRNGTRPETMRKNIFAVSDLLRGKSSFYSLDYRDILALAEPTDVVYMDPPYQGVCGDKRDSRYFSGISHADFVAALEKLNSANVPYIVSYDGRRGDKMFGEDLPGFLNLKRIELEAGRSTQATLLGREELTYESLYFSRSLFATANNSPTNHSRRKAKQTSLFR